MKLSIVVVSLMLSRFPVVILGKVYEEAEITQIESLLNNRNREAAEHALNLSLPLSKNAVVSIESEPQLLDQSTRIFLALSRAYAQLGRLEDSESSLTEVQKLLTIMSSTITKENTNWLEYYLHFSLTRADILVKQRKPTVALQTLEQAMLKYETAETGSEESSASMTSAAADCLSLLGKMQLLTLSDRVTARASLERARDMKPNDERILFEYAMVLFHFPGDSVDRPHEKAKAALLAAEALYPRIDRRLIGQVYLHYGHREWAAEQFELAVVAELSKTSGEKIDVQVLLLLAETKDSLGYPKVAEQLYETVLRIEPENAVAHAALSLLLLGTGARNYAAINACGLNTDKAIAHMASATSLLFNQGQVALSLQKAVNAAMDFCEKEFSEIEEWNKVMKPRTSARIARGQKPRTVSIARSLKAGLRKVYRVLMTTGVCTVRNMQKPNFRFHSYEMALSNMRKKFCGFLRKQALDDGVERTALAFTRFERHKESEAVAKRWKKREEVFKDSSKIPRVKVQSAAEGEQFIRRFMLENRPAVLTGFQDRWTLLSLRNESAADQLFNLFEQPPAVRVSVSETGRFDGPEPAALWGLTSGAHDVLVRPPATSMYLHHFFELMNDPTVSETFYLEYLALHQYLGEPFSRRIPMPDWLQENLKTVNISNILDHLVTNVWIGGRPTTSPLHYDDYENFLCQIVGKKEILLFPPADIGNLYYVGRPKGMLKYKFPGNFTREKSSVDTRGFVFGSSVNVDDPDLGRHPLYRKANPIRVVLSAGDTLYLPAYWHHEVQSLPAEDSESDSESEPGSGTDVWAAPLNVAVNFWFANLTAPIDDRTALGLS